MSGKHGTSAERRIAVIGAGSWGTALVKLLTGSQESVGWWVRRQATIDHIVKYGHNPDYTSGAQLDASRLSMGTDIRAVVKGADVVVLAVPSAFLKAAMDQLEPDALKGKTCFSAVKGIVPDVMVDETEEGNLFAALRTREADLEKHLTSGQGAEVKDVAREKAREEARIKLEEELKKPASERRLPELGTDKDFPLIQALNQLKGQPVVVSKTLVERPEEKKEN